MLKGLYSVHFKSSNQVVGAGLVVVNDGCINGGDISFTYQGRYNCTGSKMEAIVEVNHYAGGAPVSIFGPLRNFTLNLVGKIIDDDKFEVVGGFADSPSSVGLGPNALGDIEISGKKIADLVEGSNE